MTPDELLEKWRADRIARRTCLDCGRQAGKFQRCGTCRRRKAAQQRKKRAELRVAEEKRRDTWARWEVGLR
jgi:Zn ribbon nucleic-acid-binding protein